LLLASRCSAAVLTGPRLPQGPCPFHSTQDRNSHTLPNRFAPSLRSALIPRATNALRPPLSLRSHRERAPAA